MSQLTIYKASAGSGKTYRITAEYLKLLFQDPEKYRHILGVTFTNKATAEMKSRIIKELYSLSQGNLPSYISGICSESGIQPNEIKPLATSVLNRMLHDYSHFSISTIDSFFQRVIRSFAREIGIMQGYDVELDQKKVLLAAIDQLLFSIDEHPDLKSWIVQFAENKIVLGQSWNFIADIESLGNEIFKENFKEFADSLYIKITDKKYLENFVSNLKVQKKAIEGKYQVIFSNAQNIIQSKGLSVDDFKGKSRGFGNYINRCLNAISPDKWELSDTLRNSLDNPDAWVIQKSGNSTIVEEAYHQGLNEILRSLISMEETDLVMYRSIETIEKNIYVLGTIADLQKQLREYTADKNLFLISDSAELLYKLIDESDAPFIFERTGTYINHFMIDEFQDTSALQWKNFKPLIINSLAEGNQNWVVGDVKQSIYRWRNSDWTILADKITNEIYPHTYNIETLNYNWRSKKNLVAFNNTFFGNARQMLINTMAESNTSNEFTQILQNAYENFEQLVPEEKSENSGFVRIDFLNSENKRLVEWKTESLQKLKDNIEKVQDAGFKASDIAILVREKTEAKLIADFFMKHKATTDSKTYNYDIISGDSLQLKNAFIVKWLISCLLYISDPDDKVNSTFLTYYYFNEIISQEKSIETVFSLTDINEYSELDLFFENSSLKQFSVYELVEYLVQHFKLQRFKNELPYLLAFQDVLHQFSKKEASDLNSFIIWWEEFKENQVISMPENQDAIRLMTFHSSKGLEFPVVIIPFADWEFVKTRKSQYLWCRSDIEPFNTLEILPVNLSSNLENTVFKGAYLYEKGLHYVDNLNLLYVAFTRAVEALFICVPDYTNNKPNNIGSLICNSIKNQIVTIESSRFPALILPDYCNTDTNVFELGEITGHLVSNSISQHIVLNEMDYPSRITSDVAKQVIVSREFITCEISNLNTRLHMGNILHEIFQNIRYKSDIEKAIQKSYNEGKISENDCIEIREIILKSFENKLVENWFSNNWTVKTEASVLLPDKTQYRPDRVLINSNQAIVIDFKFGIETNTKYENQVTKYISILKDMGYAETEGYIWYVMLNKIVQISIRPKQGVLFT